MPDAENQIVIQVLTRDDELRATVVGAMTGLLQALDINVLLSGASSKFQHTGDLRRVIVEAKEHYEDVIEQLRDEKTTFVVADAMQSHDNGSGFRNTNPAITALLTAIDITDRDIAAIISAIIARVTGQQSVDPNDEASLDTITREIGLTLERYIGGRLGRPVTINVLQTESFSDDRGSGILFGLHMTISGEKETSEEWRDDSDDTDEDEDTF